MYPFSPAVKTASHIIAMIFSLVGFVLLIVFAAQTGTARHIVSFSLFGASIFIFYAISAIYHFIPPTHNSKNIFARLDRSMIYLLIAGTYTPMMLVPIQGALGITAISIIWALAFIGIALYIIFPNLKWQVVAILFIFIVMLDIITLFPVKKAVPDKAFMWLLVGSILYGLGILVFGTSHLSLARKVPKLQQYGIGHYLVIAGSAAHFILMFNYILFL
ncbi:MAG: hypothetical protein COU35_00780 [Candidatus Magasanikbacteria bacterium CG10_big_fil_rev_8_21_14_0_10_47_10]|uniref:Hemolysin n=1 Tax=Candidatus Magasanikbacteria bacterium CG10_big_fil_rev_8_21_14_0_10_47_10 TaxID=1974652 RepID=A0A2H0TRH3_9BACT|nr:MAG: hypothetical protein COU35_00780 [Candidatus Magasanikbacteria bacterium CG10_big_fil_rev_8_21_14_0_10_47_10]